MKTVPPTFAQEVRRLRTERGLTLTRLAERVRYSKGYLSKIENGQVRPTVELARAFESALAANGHLLALADTPPNPIPADDAVLIAYSSMFDQHRTVGHRSSPQAVLAGLRPQVEVLSTMARSADDPGLSRGLWLLAAKYAEYAGWMEQERGDDASAAELTKLAVRYAARGGDRELEAWALVRAAEFALYRGDAHNTVRFARQAGQARSAAVRSVAAQREAQGYALAGAASLCEAALARAAALQDQVDEPEYGTRSLVDPVAIASAWSYHDLGRHAEAAAVMDQQVPLIPPTALRARTRFGLRQALAHAAAGDLDHACALVSELLADVRQVQSATVHIDLTAFSSLLARSRPTSGRGLSEEINDILFAPAPS